VHREQAVDEPFGADRADDFEVFLAGEPPRLEQREQVGDVIEMEMCQQDGAHGLVAAVGCGQPVENAAAAVDQ